MNAQNNKPSAPPGQNGLSWATSSQNQQKPAESAHAPTLSTASAGDAQRTRAATIVGWLAAGVVGGVILAWGVASSLHGNTVAGPAASSTVASPNSQAGTQGSAAGLGSSDSLIVESPQKAGMSVAIQKAAVSEPTWVVVYESRDGQPGNILGAALFFPGQPQGSVQLLRGTTAGHTYFVTRQSDNGDRTFSKSDPLVKEDGQAVWASFVAN